MTEQENSLGKKFDAGKPPIEMLPPSYWEWYESWPSQLLALWYFYQNSFPHYLEFDAVPVLEHGRIKYGRHNWTKGMRWGRLVGAFHRHTNFLSSSGLWLPRDLNEVDEESGLPHGAHAQCCLIFLREYYDKDIGENDCPWNVRVI